MLSGIGRAGETMWQQILIVGVGGAIGAVARFGVHSYTQRSLEAFPFGTLIVNVVGCLILGALMLLVEERPDFSPTVRLFLGVGLLGSFTTFSTFGVETIDLLREKEHLLALLSVAGNLGVGLAAVLLGRGLARAIV